MQLTFTSLFMMINTVLALPSGHIFMRASCNIGACVAALAPTVVSCVGAAAQEGANLSADAGCLTGAINTGVNIPAACESCIEDFDLGDKVKDIENRAEKAVTEAIRSRRELEIGQELKRW